MRKIAVILLSALLLSGCGTRTEEPKYVSTAMHQEFLENGVVTGTYDYYAPVDHRGLVTGVEEYTDSELTFRSTFAYDEFGNTIQVTEERDGTVITADYKNTLDAQGRLLCQEIWVDGTMVSSEEHTYDIKGNETSHHMNHWNEAAKETDWRTYTMDYDRKGNLIRKELQWNFNDEYIVWEYEDGHCIRQTSYLTGTDQITEFWEYTYDNQGRCIRESKYGSTGQLDIYLEYAYDDAVRTMISTLYHPNGTPKGSFDRYTYDEHGNEILRERCEDGEVYWRISNEYELVEETH